MINKKIFSVNSNVFWLGLVSFFNDASNEMVKAVMPAFLTLTLGVTPAFVGFLDGFADAMAAILRIFSGWWSDRIGRRKRITVFGYGLSVITRWFLVIVTGFWHVFVLRVIDRVGKGVRESPRDALVTESVSPDELGRSFGFQRALDAAGGVLGPLLALLILPIVLGNYRTLFLIASIIGLFALTSFIFIHDVKKPNNIIPRKPVRLTCSLAGFSKEFKMFLTAIFIFGLGFMPIALVALKAEWALDKAEKEFRIAYLRTVEMSKVVAAAKSAAQAESDAIAASAKARANLQAALNAAQTATAIADALVTQCGGQPITVRIPGYSETFWDISS